MGGPLALVRDGDEIELDVPRRTLTPARGRRGAGAPAGGVDAAPAALHARLRPAVPRPRAPGERRAATSTSCAGARRCARRTRPARPTRDALRTTATAAAPGVRALATGRRDSESCGWARGAGPDRRCRDRPGPRPDGAGARSSRAIADGSCAAEPHSADRVTEGHSRRLAWLVDRPRGQQHDGHDRQRRRARRPGSPGPARPCECPAVRAVSQRRSGPQPRAHS